MALNFISRVLLSRVGNFSTRVRGKEKRLQENIPKELLCDLVEKLPRRLLPYSERKVPPMGFAIAIFRVRTTARCSKII